MLELSKEVNKLIPRIKIDPNFKKSLSERLVISQCESLQLSIGRGHKNRSKRGLDIFISDDVSFFLKEKKEREHISILIESDRFLYSFQNINDDKILILENENLSEFNNVIKYISNDHMRHTPKN